MSIKFTKASPVVGSGTGAISSGTTSIGIDHGLTTTPTWVTVTPTEDPANSPGAIFVTNLAASSFTVNVENDPGASGLDFIWRGGSI